MIIKQSNVILFFMGEDAVEVIEKDLGLNSTEDPIPRDSWFKAFVRGNSLWPQFGEGMVSLTASAVVDDRPADWVDFFKSIPSLDQEAWNGAIMSAHHEQAGVKIKDLTHATRADTIIDPDRLRTLWASNVRGVGDFMLGFIRGNPPNKYFTAHFSDFDIHEIDGFFKNPTNTARIEKLTNNLKAIKAKLLSKEGYDASRAYKAEIATDIAVGDKQKLALTTREGRNTCMGLIQAGLKEAEIAR